MCALAAWFRAQVVHDEGPARGATPGPDARGVNWLAFVDAVVRPDDPDRMLAFAADGYGTAHPADGADGKVLHYLDLDVGRLRASR